MKIYMKGDYNMQWTVDGKEYDTDTAEYVGRYKNTPYHNDTNFYEETLYRKKTGEFFLYGQGKIILCVSGVVWVIQHGI